MTNNLLQRTARRIRNYNIKRKPIFTQQNKLRTDAQIVSRGIISLFNPNKSTQKVSKMAKRSAGRTYLRGKNSIAGLLFRSMKAEAGYNPLFRETIIIDNGRKVVASELAAKYAHEMGHVHVAQAKGNNLAASALGVYFESMFPERINTANQNGGNLRKWAENFVPLFGVQGKKTMQILDRRQSIARAKSFTKLDFFGLNEHSNRRSLNGESISDVGERIGDIALAIELKANKPGLGLFVIRKTANGIPLSQTLENALSGKYDSELEKWKLANPQLTRMIARAHLK